MIGKLWSLKKIITNDEEYVIYGPLFISNMKVLAIKIKPCRPKKDSDFIIDYVDLLYYKCHKINFEK